MSRRRLSRKPKRLPKKTNKFITTSPLSLWRKGRFFVPRGTDKRKDKSREKKRIEAATHNNGVRGYAKNRKRFSLKNACAFFTAVGVRGVPARISSLFTFLSSLDNKVMAFCVLSSPKFLLSSLCSTWNIQKPKGQPLRTALLAVGCERERYGCLYINPERSISLD